MPAPLFVYGTLMDPDILALVLGRVHDVQLLLEAQAHGFRTALMPQRSYPGLGKAPGERVAGRIVTGLGAEDWRRLDDFEGEEYRRGTIEVKSAEGPLTAQAYFPAIEPPADAPSWSFDFWQRNHKAKMLVSAAARR